MKKGLIIVVAFVILILIMPSSVCLAEEKDGKEQLGEEVDKTLEDLDLAEFEEYIGNLELFYNSGGVKQFIKELTDGNVSITPRAIIDSLFSSLIGGFTDVLPTLIGIIAIAVLFSIIFGLTQGFLKKQTVDIVYFVCYSAIVTTVVAMVTGLVKDIKRTIEVLAGIVNAVYPPLVTLLTAVGGGVSTGLFDPGLAIVSSLVGNIMTVAVLPLFIATVVFSIVGSISDNVKLDKLQSATRYIGGGVMTLTFGGLIAYLSISGLIGGTVDSASIKATKYLVSSYVPVIGGYLSQGVDLVRVGMVIVKNALGVSGIIAVILIVLTPAIKLLALTVGLKLTAGIIEPITDKRLSGFINNVSESVRQLLGAVLGVGFVFILSLSMLLFTLNAV